MLFSLYNCKDVTYTLEIPPHVIYGIPHLYGNSSLFPSPSLSLSLLEKFSHECKTVSGKLKLYSFHNISRRTRNTSQDFSRYSRLKISKLQRHRSMKFLSRKSHFKIMNLLGNITLHHVDISILLKYPVCQRTAVVELAIHLKRFVVFGCLEA